ncbi:MAG: transcriptional repressor NrdR [Clostridia bacterium]|nr:transcriptional repressor NrdR [Clostridia bacterium]
MKCIFCGDVESKVIDSRATDDFSKIRRRRECLSCGRRFTTYEVIETTPILVIKNDGTRQPFDRAKIEAGVIRACEKRPVSASDINALVSSVEKQITNMMEQEISSYKIGELVMAELKELDQVAYIRFASVYRQFRDLSTFTQFINEFEKKMLSDK